jgi:hypothetical protein
MRSSLVLSRTGLAASYRLVTTSKKRSAYRLL